MIVTCLAFELDIGCMSSLLVLVIGGGPGGLCLAQGLK
jgi:hypothetical protein